MSDTVASLTFVRKGRLEWREIPRPALQGPREAIVRPIAAARCDADCLFLFHDYSRASRETLPRDEAREATDHYAVLLTSCLQEFGEKSGSGRYKVSWTILNDGHVTNVAAVNVDPQGQLLRCLKSQFAHWRYPRYKGEWQHVEQEFRVSGTTR